MNNIQEEKLLIGNFLKLSFYEKKKDLLYILRALDGVSEKIDILGNLVFNTTEKKYEYTLVNVYGLLLKAMHYSRNKKNAEAIGRISLVNDALNDIKKEEQIDGQSDEFQLEELIKTYENK